MIKIAGLRLSSIDSLEDMLKCRLLLGMVVPVLGRLRREDQESKASLGLLSETVSKNKKNAHCNTVELSPEF
jgi:hypothetical protein